MKKSVFKKIDAFATKESEGNPAAAIYLNAEHDISVQEMQRIAKELKGFVSEVGYVRQVDGNTFNLKYYSSEREVDFCGHATIAIMYDLLINNAELMKSKRETAKRKDSGSTRPLSRDSGLSPMNIALIHMLNPYRKS